MQVPVSPDGGPAGWVILVWEVASVGIKPAPAKAEDPKQGLVPANLLFMETDLISLSWRSNIYQSPDYLLGI